jgi:predicted RNA-binding Zn-ribbon protein involved in translation (DUF1610 family)
MEHCPRCHSTIVRRARTRTLIERLKRSLTSDRLHRCPDCGWRGWGPDGSHRVTPAIVAAQLPDFMAIEAELSIANQVTANSPIDRAAPDDTPTST